MTERLTSTELIERVWQAAGSRMPGVTGVDEIAAALSVEAEEVEAALLVLAAAQRVELDQYNGRMAVTGVAEPEEAPPPATAERMISQIDAVVDSVERAGAKLRLVMWFAPFAGFAGGAVLGAVLSEHDRVLTALCVGVFGGIVGYMLRDLFGPRSWLDWFR